MTRVILGATGLILGVTRKLEAHGGTNWAHSGSSHSQPWDLPKTPPGYPQGHPKGHLWLGFGALRAPNIPPKKPQTQAPPGIFGPSSRSPGTCGMGGRWSQGCGDFRQCQGHAIPALLFSCCSLLPLRLFLPPSSFSPIPEG